MKKILSILLVAVMLLPMNVTAFSSAADDESFCIDNYIQYTINFSDTQSKTRSVTENTIDAAISYVESLKLSDMGYSHIEEACLGELKGIRRMV